MAGIKLKVHPNFPSAVYATSPLTLTKIDGNFTFGLDLNALTASLLPIFAGTYLPLAGGTMTGNLILAHDPTLALEAATKNYVDTHAGAIPEPPNDTLVYGRKVTAGVGAWARAVALAGDTMTGALALFNGSTAPTQAVLNNSTAVATTAYVDRASRPKAQANTTYFVRTDGNNANTGLVDSAGGAFLTIQKAIDVVAAIDWGGLFQPTIQIGGSGAGRTFTAGFTLGKPIIGANSVNLVGDTVTPSNVTVNVAGNAFICDGAGANVDISGFTLTTTAFGTCLVAANGSRIRTTTAIVFGASTGHVQAQYGGRIYLFNSYAITGSATSFHLLAQYGGYILAGASITVTITGTPTFANFAQSTTTGTIETTGVTYSGAVNAATTRYNCATAGGINTSGGGANYFPGGIAGTTNTSPNNGWYV